jgi:hypothetical protein
MRNITHFKLEKLKKASSQNYFRCTDDDKKGLERHNLCGVNLAVSELGKIKGIMNTVMNMLFP